MLIKYIMDKYETISHIYSNTFIFYNKTFENYSNIKFFYFAIKNNYLIVSNNEKAELVDLYIKSKKIINILNKFSKKIKLFLYKKYDNNKDLHFNSLDRYKENEIINIIQNKTIYKFRILDLIYLWKIALLKSENMFSIPKELKNPFTNIIFENHNLYNIFFSFNKTTYVIPEIILSFFKCSFNYTDFKKKNYPILQENAIEYYGKNAHYMDLLEYLVTLLYFFRKYINYTFLKNNLSYFKKKWIIKNMKEIIILFLKYKFLCNPLLKDKYHNEIKIKLINYFKYNYTSDHFINLSQIEQNAYERNLLNNDISLNNTTIPPPPPPPLRPTESPPPPPPPPPPSDTAINTAINTTINSAINSAINSDRNNNIRLVLDSDSNEDIFNAIPTNRFTYRRRHSRYPILPPINAINSIINMTETQNTTNPFRPTIELPRTPTNNIIRNRFTLF